VEFGTKYVENFFLVKTVQKWLQDVLTLLIVILQLLLEFEGLAQECEGDNAVLSQRLKSLATELQSVVEKQLQVSAAGTSIYFSCR